MRPALRRRRAPSCPRCSAESGGSAAATAGSGRTRHEQKATDTKAGPEGKRRPLSPRARRGARPSTPPGQRPLNLCDVGSPGVAGPAWGPFAYSTACCPGCRSPRAAARPVFLPPHFLASLSPPAVPAPRAGSACWTLSLPLIGDGRPTKGPGSQPRLRARSTPDGGEMGTGCWDRVGGVGGPVTLIWQFQPSATSHPTYVSHPLMLWML